MKKEFRDLFYSERYEEIKNETKLLIQNKPNDAELWYCLFLAENTNYIDIDFEKINNEICFNKAIELANKRQREEFNSEYNLYRDLSKYPNLRKIVRYAEFGSYERVIELFGIMDDDKVEISEENDIYSNLDYCFCNSSSPAVIDCSLLVINLLYLKTGKEEYLEILGNLISNASECESGLHPYVLSEDIGSLFKKVDLLEKLYDSGEEKDSVARLLAKIEINLADSNFNVAEELISEVIEQDPNCAKAYWYLIFVKREAASISDLTSEYFDIQENTYFKKAYELADDEFRQILDDVTLTLSQQSLYESAVEKMEDYPIEALQDFSDLEDYKDSAQKLIVCKELIYQEAKNSSSPSDAIEYLEYIIDYKDSKELIEKFKKQKTQYEAERRKREKKEKVAQGFSNFFSGIGDFFGGIGDFFYYNEETLNKVFNILLSVLSFVMAAYFVVNNGLGVFDGFPESGGLLIAIIFNAILLISAFFVPGEKKAFYKFPLAITYMSFCAFVFNFETVSAFIWLGTAIVFVIITSIRQKSFNGTVFFTSLIGIGMSLLTPDLGAEDSSVRTPFAVIIAVIAIMNRIKAKKGSSSRSKSSSSSRSRSKSSNRSGGKISNIIVSALNIFFAVYVLSMKQEAFINDENTTIMIIYGVSLLVLSFFLPRREDAFYKYSFVALFLSLGISGAICYEEQFFVWLVIGGVVTLITSIKQGTLNGTLLFSVIFGLMAGYIGMQDPTYVFIPFVGVAILALIVGRQNDNDLSRYLSNACGVGLIVLFVSALFNGYYVTPYMMFSFRHHICLDLLGLSIVLSATSEYDNEGIGDFAAYTYYITTIASILFVIMISGGVIGGVYEGIYLDFSLYGMYFYLLVPIIICVIMMYFDTASVMERVAPFKWIIGLLLCLLALMAAYKTLSSFFGCGYVEGCGSEQVTYGCDDCGTWFGTTLAQAVLAIVYFCAGCVYIAIEDMD